jgi:hypothetical protein
MPLNNEVVLRSRFKLDLNKSDQKALQLLKNKEQSNYIIASVDQYVFIKIPKEKQHFWSPQHHIEIDPVDEKPSILSRLFGPNPTVWTMFMFFYFVVAGLFVGLN